MRNSFIFKSGRWLIGRLACIPERDRYLSVCLMIAFFIATMMTAIVVAIGNPTGASLYSHVINISKAMAINGLAYLVWTAVIGALLSFMFVPLPRLFLGSLSYTICSSILVLQESSSGKLFSYIVGIGYSLIAIVLGLLFFVLFHRKIGKSIKIGVFASILILSSTYFIFDKVENKMRAVPTIGEYTEPVEDDNPANKGQFDVSFFTYGSGDDLHREKFGADVDQLTPTVDASDFITTWSKDREGFWGFGPSELPVNGRAWVPEGEGTFPIVLMVHGNHTMEYFSTGGYDYIGELLASRGFIAISVDEDFINYSNVYGIPNDNYDLRAWMFLQHLASLQDMNEDPESLFYDKIDFEQVALVGHSRGGQAALMAADYTSFFSDENLLDRMNDVDIKAVVAIAPTDKSIDGKKPHIHNTSYLLLHGANDADLYNFRGDQQFYRTTFDDDYDGFKTTLYIEGANHTQFNTDWGRTDLSLPRGIFLSHRQTMAPEDQRQIAKVYMSAFFESVFHGQSSYEKLFQDHRYGKDWLPDTTLVNKYHHASYAPMVTFNAQEMADESNANGFTTFETETPKDRIGNNRPADALRLEWDSNASYTVDVTNNHLMESNSIVLTMANVDGETEAELIPDIQVELETTDGESAQLPLDDFMSLPPVIKTDYTYLGLLDNLFRDGKYEQSWEPIFQTFEIPIDSFGVKGTINKITLHFQSRPGKILLEEIGMW